MNSINVMTKRPFHYQTEIQRSANNQFHAEVLFNLAYLSLNILLDRLTKITKNNVAIPELVGLILMCNINALGRHPHI
jgi:hypothetical protein